MSEDTGAALARLRELAREWRDPEFWKERGSLMDSRDCAMELEAVLGRADPPAEGWRPMAMELLAALKVAALIMEDDDLQFAGVREAIANAERQLPLPPSPPEGSQP